MWVMRSVETVRCHLGFRFQGQLVSNGSNGTVVIRPRCGPLSAASADRERRFSALEPRSVLGASSPSGEARFSRFSPIRNERLSAGRRSPRLPSKGCSLQIFEWSGFGISEWATFCRLHCTGVLSSRPHGFWIQLQTPSTQARRQARQTGRCPTDALEAALARGDRRPVRVTAAGVPAPGRLGRAGWGADRRL